MNLMEVLVKDDLIQIIKDSFYHNTHVTEEGRQLHRQEHFHLLKLIEKMPSYEINFNYPLDKKEKM